MGILPEVRAAGYSVKEVRLVDGEGERVGGFSTAALGSVAEGRFISLPRGDLAALIYRRIEGRIETVFNDSVSAIEESGSGLLVSFEKGQDRRFDLLVGADGLHSAVRKLTFHREAHCEKRLGYYVSAFEAKHYRPRDELVYVSYADPGRQVARFALHDDRTMFFFIFSADRMNGAEPLDIEERREALRRVFAGAGWETPGILELLDDTPDIYFDRVSQIKLDSWSAGRVVLIGDAGACVSLLAGEGTGLAMTEAFVLAGELKRAGGDHREAFSCYERKLRPFVAGKQRSALSFASSFAPRTRFGVWARNQATKLFAVPPLARYILARSLRDELFLADYEM
jgi:2-polyprenyl-6-methoxyphenol hydroxylase-like FAD-dependent oxidoreductase